MSKIGKHLAIWLLTLASLAIITGIGLYIFRVPLIASLISYQLREQNIPMPSLSVVDISLNSLLLRDLTIGTAKELHADKIHVSWHLRDLLAGTVDSVEMSGLHMALDLSGERPPLGSLQPLLSSAGENSSPIRLPAISFRDSAIHVRSAWGDAVIALTGNLDQTRSDTLFIGLDAEITGPAGQAKSTLAVTLDAQGNLQGKMTIAEGRLSLPEAQISSFTGDAAFMLVARRPQHISAEFLLADIHLPGSGQVEPPSEQVFEQARFSLHMDESNARLIGKLLTSADTLVAELDVTARYYLNAPDINLVFNANSPARHYPWQLLGLAQPSAGSVVLAMKISGQTPPFQEFRHDGLNGLSWLQHSTLTGQAQLELQALSFPQKVTNLNGKLGLDGAFAQGSGKLDLHVDADRLIAGQLIARRVSIALPMQIHLDHDVWRMALQKVGRATLDAIDPINAVSLKDPLSLSISQADIELVKKPQGLVLKHHLAAAATAFTLLVEQEEAQAVEAQIHPGKITLSGGLVAGEEYQGRGAIKGMSLTLPQLRLQLTNIAAALQLGTGTGKIADFTIGQLHHQTSTPYFAPLSVSGSIQSVRGQSSVYAMDVAGGTPGLRYLTLTGKLALDKGDGMLKVAITPLTFAAGGLQPKTLLPALAQLEDVSGMVSARAQFEWSREGMRSSGVVDLDHVSFVHPTTKISNLNATLSLNDLLSPSSPSRQTLTIQRIDPGIPLERLVVFYQIEGSPPRIALEKADLFLLGGSVSLGPAIIDPASARTDFVIRVDDIDLEVLFDQIQVEGLTGNGRVSGSIPVTFEGSQITIRNSHLVAEAPGVLHFQSDKASQLLAGAGKEMDWLLQALQDFHYSELSLKLDKSAAHDLVATLSLLGNNPNVKEGQMFRLNLNLESNIGEILQAIGQGYRLSSEVLRDLFRLH
ncbi:YdbH domain-containing protein [Nitrosomonas sp. Nm132]|uniref:intermembrane phospholipid transport protein YdbH family protein n=1 Tax=Nitrosomonas sp. Nm132 TaxID=1881053 RepID=UPI0015A33C38|nr:YdbH domain-containing protein [Nitrosomonas sp. Nm132]